MLSVISLAVELGMLSPQEAKLAEARREALRKAGIKISIGQTLLERRFVAPADVKKLMAEFNKRITPNAPRKQGISAPAVKRLGSFEILECLSEKTHSRIYKARDLDSQRMVVLKVLPRMLKDDPHWSERFRRETELLHRLGHPNLVQAYDATEIEGCPAIVMEYVEGSSIGDRIENEGNIPEKESWLIGRDISRGLAHTAELGIVHRDIKPDNIVSSRGGKVKLIDMGFSKNLNEHDQLTMEGTTVGTPFYISPEQARGDRDLDVRTDVYSLGCTLYHMLTGSPPFHGDKIIEVMMQHLEAPRPDPRAIVPELCERTSKLIARMMAVDPARRPANPDAVIEEINELIPHLPKLNGPGNFSGVVRAAAIPSRKSDVFRIPARTGIEPEAVKPKTTFWSRLGAWWRRKKLRIKN